MALGTAAAMIGASAIGAGVQAKAAGDAADAQTGAANKSIRYQEQTRDLIRSDLAPYREGGVTAQQALDYELGLGAAPMIGAVAPTIEQFQQPKQNALAPAPTWIGSNGQTNQPAMQPQAGKTAFRVNGQIFATRAEAEAYANANRTGGTEYGGFTKTPGYDFRLKQGNDNIEAGAAARGGLYSGAAMKALQQHGQDYATSEYQPYLNRLAGRADSGLSAAQMSGAASQNAAAGITNALGNIGNAQAAGSIGVGNAITGGIQNALGAWSYQRNLAQQPLSPQFGGGR